MKPDPSSPIPLFPDAGLRPMRTLVFASGGPGNFNAALELAAAHPDWLSIELLVTDRPATPAEALARERGVPALCMDFDAFARSGPSGRPPAAAREAFHDAMLTGIKSFEDASGRRLDFGVLAYRRIITGRLLDYFDMRLINQHPADLAICAPDGRRLYTGMDGHRRSLTDGRGGARTTTILVDAGVDTGEIICRGPFCAFTGNSRDASAIARHEEMQKQHSDWPSLQFALAAIATGALSRSPGRPVRFYLNGAPAPETGIEVRAPEHFKMFDEARDHCRAATPVGGTDLPG